MQAIKFDIDLFQFQYVYSYIRELQLLQLGAYGNDETLNGQLEAGFRDQLKLSLLDIEGGIREISLSSLDVSQSIVDMQQSSSIQMFFTPEESTLYDFNEATQQLITKSFNIQNTPLNNLNMFAYNPDVYFVMTNGYNSYLIAQMNISDLYIEDFKGRTADKSAKFLVIVLVSGISLGLTILILIPVMLSVRYSKEESIKLFLEVPDKTVKLLYAKCEGFISSLQIGEDDDQVSEIEYEFEKNEEDSLIAESTNASKQGRKKRRKYKNSAQTSHTFYVQLAIGVKQTISQLIGQTLIMQGYFVFNYFMSKTLMEEFRQLIVEINATSFAEGFYASSENIQNSLFIDNQFKALNQSALNISITNLDLMYQLDSLIHREHSSNIQIHTDRYKAAFNEIMMQNPCPVLLKEAKIPILDCQTFAGGTISQGLSVGITRFFENLRYLLTLYLETTTEPVPEFSEIIPDNNKNFTFKNVVDDRVDNIRINLLNLEESIEVKQLMKTYFKHLLGEFRSSIQQKHKDYVTQRVALFIIFDIFLLIIYIIFWVPLANKFTQDIWKTRYSLIMIPVLQIIKLKNIKGYIRLIINEKNQNGADS